MLREMPKAKEPANSSAKISASDVKAFLADLDTDQPVVPDQPTVSPQPNVEPPAAGKKVQVKEESGVQAKKSKTPTNTTEIHSAEIKNVLHGDGDGSEPPKEMGKLQRGPKRPFPWGWTLGGLAIVAAVTLGGFFWFNRAQRFTGEKVQLQVTTNAEAASGSDITITFQYQNLEPVDLARAELTVEYPEGFTITRTSQPSANEFTNAFELGTIKSGRAGSLTVEGSIFGSVGTERVFSATLNYRPANFSSDFQVDADTTVKITSSILELELDGPKQLAPNGSGTWTITYRNTASRDLTDVQIEAVYPEGIEVTKVEPAAVERSALWRFDTIKQSEEGKITITGTATGEVGDTLELIARAGLVTTTNTVDLQAEQKILVVLVNTGLTAAVSVNGATEKSVVAPGESLQYVVRISNLGEAEINDITTVITLDGPVDFDQLDNPSKAERSDSKLTWTKDNVLALEQLKPGQDATLKFTVRTPKTLSVTSDDDIDQKIVATVTLSSPTLPEGGQQPTTFTTKLATVATFTAESRYYDDNGIALGSGPIPPVEGETTAYRILWTVTNTTSEASNLTVTANLPVNVFWTGQHVGRDAGDIAFNADTRTVTWTLNKIPAGTGSRLPKLQAYFEVSVTPTADDVGSSMVLTQTATSKAADGFTERAISITQPSVTTDIPTDPIQPGAGKVKAA